MSVYDKVPPGGSFRAPLNADWADADCNKVFLVELNTSGRVVKSTGTAGTNGNVVGVLVCRGMYDSTGVLRGPKAGEVVDVMKRGEIVEVGTDVASAGAGLAAFYTTASGALTTVATGGARFGHFVEATRLVVNFAG
jgi:hypothetical protein